EKPRRVETVKEEGKAGSFEEEIRALLEDARKLNADKDPHLTALIDGVKVEQRRGSVRGPSSLNGTVAPGECSTYTFRFIGGAPARVVLTSTNGVPLQLEVYNCDDSLGGIPDQRIGVGTGRGTSEVNWTPAYTRNFYVYVTNRGARAGNFTLMKN